MSIGAALMGSSMEFHQEIKNWTSIWPGHPTSVHISKRNEKKIWKRDLLSHHCSFFFFLQKSRQGNKLSVYQWMNGQRRFGVYMPEIELLRVTRTFQWVSFRWLDSLMGCDFQFSLLNFQISLKQLFVAICWVQSAVIQQISRHSRFPLGK